MINFHPKLDVLDVLDVLDDSSAQPLGKMSKAALIHRERWILQAGGTAKLREDDFEAQGN